ncbi:hypothetical protein DL98DRAFT_604638 [Cadophora sp. DSE1049]|nr:hypothetical protein DL98DRAFT_604638 [Cadophora sp. DSE1049]
MSSLPPTSKRPRISAILDDVSSARETAAAPSTKLGSMSMNLSSISFKGPNQDSQPDLKPKIVLDFRKLPREILLLILDILEADRQTAALSALARSNREIYEFANPLVYRNVRLRDLASSYLLVCTMVSNRDLGMLTRSLYSDVQWFNHHPFHIDVAATPQWRIAAEQKIMKDFKFISEGILSFNIFQSWHSITALLLLYMPNLRTLHLPRYFEAVDRGMRETIMNIPHFVHCVAGIHLEMSKPGSDYPENRVPLRKLQVLDLLPDSADGWNHFRARPVTKAACFFSLQPFLRIRSIKVLRTVLDERVAAQQYLPVGTPTVRQQLEEGGAVRLEELELVARWTEISGAHDYLRSIVEGVGRGSLKSFKLRWLQENVYPNYMTWLAPNHHLRVPQTILRPSEIGQSLGSVADTLEELVLPDGGRIPDMVFGPFLFGQGNAFPKLRVLQGSMEMLFGRHLFGLDFSQTVAREYILQWSKLAAPSALERLDVKTWGGKLPSGLAEAFIQECGWVVE